VVQAEYRVENDQLPRGEAGRIDRSREQLLGVLADAMNHVQDGRLVGRWRLNHFLLRLVIIG
jgi:hypothetical protein